MENSLKEDSSSDLAAIDNLPNEILVTVLDYIPSPERNNLRIVSKKWTQVMDNEVGIELRIGQPSVFDSRYKEAEKCLKYHPYEVLSRVGVCHLVVGSLTEERQEKSYSWFEKVLNMFRKEDGLTGIKSPDIIKKIGFCSPILPLYFQPLLSMSVYLRSLDIHVSALSRLEPINLQGIDLPWLEVMLVKIGRNVYEFSEMQYGEIKEWNNEDIHRKVLALCSNHFPKLQEATIESLYDFDLGIETMRTYLQFLHLHRASLRKFCLIFGLLIHEQFVQINDPINVGEHDLLEFAMDLKQSYKLKRINIMSMCLAILPYPNVWSHFIQIQRQLEVLTLTGILFKEEFIQKIVDFNFSSLKNICISRIHLFDNSGPMQFNCRIFSPCESLKCLTLRGWTVTMAVKALTNVKELPKSLTQIDFGDLAIATDDVRFIALEMPNLSDLELRHVGHSRDMGMDVSTFQEIVNRRKLKALRVLRSFSQPIRENEVFNGDENDPEYFTESPRGFVGIVLGARGFYKAILVNNKLF